MGDFLKMKKYAGSQPSLTAKLLGCFVQSEDKDIPKPATNFVSLQEGEIHACAHEINILLIVKWNA